LGRRLGVAIANAINTFDPDLVVIGGGVCFAGELLLGPAREEAARHVLTGVGTRTQICPSTLRLAGRRARCRAARNAGSRPRARGGRAMRNMCGVSEGVLIMEREGLEAS